MIKFIILTFQATLLLLFFIFVIIGKAVYTGVKKSDIEDMFVEALNIFELNTYTFRERLKKESK